MNDSMKPEKKSKSPLVFLLLMSVLVIATLVAASEFFLRPQMEVVFQEKVTMNSSQTHSLKVSEQDTTSNSFSRFDKSTSNH